MSAEGGGHGESGGAIVAALLANLGIAVAKFVGFLVTGSSARWPSRSTRWPMPATRACSCWVGEGPAASRLRSTLSATGAVAISGPSWSPSCEFVRSSRSPELPVLLLEDSGALVGLVFATSGVALALITGNPVFDGIGTLAIGVLLVAIAIVLAIEMKSLLIGEAAAPETIEAIEAELGASPGVRGVIHMLTQHLGPDELLVAAKLEFDPSLSVAELAAAIDGGEARVRSVVPIATVIYLEPDLSGP